MITYDLSSLTGRVDGDVLAGDGVAQAAEAVWASRLPEVAGRRMGAPGTWQLEESGGQWSRGQCAPGYPPPVPWSVPADEVDGGALRLRSWVNGEPRQDSSTADLISSGPLRLPAAR